MISDGLVEIHLYRYGNHQITVYLPGVPDKGDILNIGNILYKVSTENPFIWDADNKSVHMNVQPLDTTKVPW